MTAEVPTVATARGRRGRLTVAAGLSGILALLVTALWFGGGAPDEPVAGLPDAGPVTGWGLPVARLLADAAGTVAVGAVLAAAFLLPSAGSGRLSGPGRRCLRAASAAAWAWCAAAVTALLFTVSDVLGQPLPDAVSGNTVVNVVRVLPQAQALVVVAVLTAVLALWAQAAGTVTSAAWLLVVAVAALLPPAVNGHSHEAGNHDIAVVAVAFHIAAAALWTGGLGALVWQARRLDAAALGAAVGRFSRLALWCFVAVAASGAVNAWVRLPAFGDLVSSRYGQLLLVKTAALVAVGTAGCWHRRRTIPALAAGARRPLLRLAAVEVAVLGAAVTLAAALSRTPPPAREVSDSPAAALLGFDLPPPVTPARLVTEIRPDLGFLTLVAVGAGFYLAGVRRLYRAGVHWPAGRTAAWLTGLAVVAFATSSGLGVYGRVLFSVHMVQHLLLAMLAPILLVLGAPVTLALRALPAAPGDTRTARQWVLRMVHSRATRVVAHPGVALPLFTGSMFIVYFSPIYPWTLDNHLVHLAVMGHFLASGCLFFWTLIGIDPGPKRLPHPARVLLLFVAIAIHGFFGVALLQSTELLGADFYTALDRPWGASPLKDQQLGGGIAWSFGELPAVATLAALFFQWAGADERRARQLDRKLDADNDDTLDAYNRWLAELDRRGPRT
jgi:putative copper resistance protein D